jgi:hypothetical protein
MAELKWNNGFEKHIIPLLPEKEENDLIRVEKRIKVKSNEDGKRQY